MATSIRRGDLVRMTPNLLGIVINPTYSNIKEAVVDVWLYYSGLLLPQTPIVGCEVVGCYLGKIIGFNNNEFINDQDIVLWERMNVMLNAQPRIEDCDEEESDEGGEEEE